MTSSGLVVLFITLSFVKHKAGDFTVGGQPIFYRPMTLHTHLSKVETSLIYLLDNYG